MLELMNNSIKSIKDRMDALEDQSKQKEKTKRRYLNNNNASKFLKYILFRKNRVMTPNSIIAEITRHFATDGTKFEDKKELDSLRNSLGNIKRQLKMNFGKEIQRHVDNFKIATAEVNIIMYARDKCKLSHQLTHVSDFIVSTVWKDCDVDNVPPTIGMKALLSILFCKTAEEIKKIFSDADQVELSTLDVLTSNEEIHPSHSSIFNLLDSAPQSIPTSDKDNSSMAD